MYSEKLFVPHRLCLVVGFLTLSLVGPTALAAEDASRLQVKGEVSRL